MTANTRPQTPANVTDLRRQATADEPFKLDYKRRIGQAVEHYLVNAPKRERRQPWRGWRSRRA